MQTTYLSMYIGALQVPVVMMMMMMNILYAMYLVQLLIRKKTRKKKQKKSAVRSTAVIPTPEFEHCAFYALTDHATKQNHVINWSQATVIDREPERFTRWIKEAIHIRKEGQQTMNGDEGSYQLSHAYDRFLDTASSRCVKNRKN